MKYLHFIYDCFKNFFEHTLKHNKLFVVSLILAFYIAGSIFNMDLGAEPFIWEGLKGMVIVFVLAETIAFVTRKLLKVIGYSAKEK